MFDYIRTFLIAATAAAAPLSLSAQNDTLLTAVGGRTSVPTSTVVDVQQTPLRVVEHTTEYTGRRRDMSRTERRALRAERFAAKVDSLVESRNYVFWPNSMQQIPAGDMRLIYAEYFYFGLFGDHVEVHLPTERGVTQYVEILNFDSMSIRGYRASQTQAGWHVVMRIDDGDSCYVADMAVSTVTGETVLTLLAPSVTMRYVGSILGHTRNFRPAD